MPTISATRDTYTTPDFRDAVHEKLADFVGANANEVALMNNTTDGMITGTWGPVIESGDEIVFTNHDHGGGANPVLQRAHRDGLNVKIIDIADRKFHPAGSPDDYLKVFEAALTPKSKLLSFCHINYTDGGILPVKEICEMARARGVLTIVDGAQPPGMMKFDRICLPLTLGRGWTKAAPRFILQCTVRLGERVERRASWVD